MSVLFIGINPTKAQYRKGCAWFRLQEWIMDMKLGFVAFTNLSDDPHWDKKYVDYSFLSRSIDRHDKIVALGGMVSKHLNKIGVDHFTLPHPSPLNRQINDPDYIRIKLEECKEYVKE